MNRTDIINALITKIGAKSYLEIGVDNGVNFNNIRCRWKTGVDPVDHGVITDGQIIQATSDQFFSRNTELFDVIFIDGLHHADQVERDIRNSLNVLKPGGFVVCHDMNPQSEQAQVIPFFSGHWNGDCWKAFVKLRGELNGVEMLTVDTDEGCGVIWQQEGSVPVRVSGELTYSNLEKNRNDWLNIMTVDQFKTKFALPPDDFNTLLRMYSEDPANAQFNFTLARYYDKIDQKAAAVTFYTRAAERATDQALQYECLIRAAQCFEWQGTRGLSVRGLLQRALTVNPARPEAYYYLSRWYENDNTVESWVNCYTVAVQGLAFADFTLQPVVEYPGKWGLLFEKAVSAWWVGLCEESKDTFIELLTQYPIDRAHRQAALRNLGMMNQFVTKEITAFTFLKHHRLLHRFPGSEAIDRNYSEAYQDMFVLTALNGKRGGTFLELGAGNPFYGNNTWLLESQFGWTGISVDYDQKLVDEWAKNGRTGCVYGNALQLNYAELLRSIPGEFVDYLQVDLDPPEVSLAALRKVLSESGKKFRVITFEHDSYCHLDNIVQQESIDVLREAGYVRVGVDIAPDSWRNYEDWWVHQDCLEHHDYFESSKRSNGRAVMAEELFLSAP